MTLCPVCHNNQTDHVLMLENLPVFCNVLYETQQEATAVTRGTITLTYCRTCGHLLNDTFDASKMAYGVNYENSLHFSGRFQQYATQLAHGLIERHQIRHKQIIGIGSGKGDFLRLLCQLGQNQAIGFDPSYGGEADEKVRFIQDNYSEKYADFPTDMISCRHVLEHVPDPRQLLEPVKQTAVSDTLIFFEVPNTLYTLQDLGIWDLIYEHCAYYTPSSLAYAFTQQGFQVQQLETVFGNQFLTLEAFPSTTPPTMPDHLLALTELHNIVQQFSNRFANKMDQWQTYLNQWQNKKVVIWGTGSKGVTFLNLLGKTIQYAVDINPRKQGRFVAGTGQRIVSPTFLQTYQPDLVIIMNGNYESEIRQTLAEIGLHPEVYLA